MSMSRNFEASEMRLYDRYARRLYINAEERHRFLGAASIAKPEIRAFCLTLFYTGCRISEALELNARSLQPSNRLVTFRTLKRRNPQVYREVPVPPVLVGALGALSIANEQTPDLPLWHIEGQPQVRSTAYRWVKRVMKDASIEGAQATPKGLRHGYGIHAIRCGVQLNMLQKWMGHASMTTTAIYANALGPDELAIADRMWATSQPSKT